MADESPDESSDALVPDPDEEFGWLFGLPRHDNYVTVLLILINWAVFIILAARGKETLQWRNHWGSMWPYGVLWGQWWRPLTHMFLHRDPFHILINTLLIYVFGRKVERALGHGGFLFLYLSAGLVSSLADWLYFNMHYSGSVGSSGAMSGIFGAYFFLYHQILYRVSHKARRIAWLWILFFVLAYMPGLFASIAHILGMATGFLCMALAYSRRLRKPRTQRWKLQLGLSACAVFLVFAPLLVVPNPSRLMRQVQTAMDEGQYAQAVEKLTHLIQLFPKYGYAYEQRAFCHDRLGQYEEFERDLDLGVKMDPRSPSPLVYRGQHYFNKGELAKARADFYQASRLTTAHGLLEYGNGLYALHTGAYQDAIAKLTTACADKYVHPYARPSRGLAYYATDRIKQAEADWRQAAQEASTPAGKAGISAYLDFIDLRGRQWNATLKHAREFEAIDKDPPYNGLARLIAADQLGQKISAEERAQVYRKLRKEELWELKILLPPSLWHYLDPIGESKKNVLVPAAITATSTSTIAKKFDPSRVGPVGGR